MCISCCTESDAGREQASAISRRSILAGIGALAAAAGVTACASPSSTRPLESAAAAPAAVPNPDAHFEIVLLGTQAGPPIAADRTGISTALVVDGTTYVVDCGRASATQYRRAGLQFATLRNIFITHLHADHIADYYNFFMLGGGTIPQIGDGVSGPVDVYGPGPAGGLPQAFGGRTVPVTHPADPTPGLAELTRKCTEAYAYSNNVLMRDTGLPDTSTMPVVHEIALPELGADFTNTCPPCAPFTVMRDDRVHVTATLVPHGPAFPSFAYRFDTEYGAVTFSGDTTVSDNLVELARGSDVLIHEAVNLEGSALTPAARDHMLQSHVEVQQVGAIAERAGVPKLVLSHIIDFAHGVVDPHQWTEWAGRGYAGEVVIGNDLQRITVR